jgi:hypothetical protein
VNIYEIRVQGRLDRHWATWFAGLTLAYEDDNTVLRGSLADEAALHGVLTKIAGLNLHLVSVHVVDASGAGGTTSDSSAAIGEAIVRDQAPLEAPPSKSAADTPTSKRKPRPPRAFRRKRPST